MGRSRLEVEALPRRRGALSFPKAVKRPRRLPLVLRVQTTFVRVSRRSTERDWFRGRKRLRGHAQALAVAGHGPASDGFGTKARAQFVQGVAALELDVGAQWVRKVKGISTSGTDELFSLCME